MSSSGQPLVPVGDDGVQCSLSGVPVSDGAVLEVSTDVGWVTGHYRERVHPDTGEQAFEMHLVGVGAAHDHVTVFLPADALLRWPSGAEVPHPDAAGSAAAGR